MNLKDKKIVTIIVTYNRVDLLRESISALSKSTIKTDILVVNNKSTDETIDFLNEVPSLYKDIKFYIYNLGSNLNGAGGFNYGINIACSLDYDYFWIMDDDCIVNDDSLYNLCEADKLLKGEYGFLSSKVLWTDGSICKTNVQRKSVAQRISDFNTKLVNVDFASFVSLFVKKVDVFNIGLPIKEFIIWTDDLEWTRRLTYNKIYKQAKPGYLCNDSIVTHKCASNIGVTIVKDTSSRLDRYKYIYRNDVYCFRREGIRGHIYMLIRNIYHIFSILLFSKTKKIYKIKILLAGYLSGFSFNPKIEFYHKT